MEEKGWLLNYSKGDRPALNAFLLGTHSRLGSESVIRSLPIELIKLIFSFLELQYRCEVCSKRAVFACANRPKARDTYVRGCFFLSCREHTRHVSTDCLKKGRFCNGCEHSCHENTLYCGTIEEFGVPQQTREYINASEDFEAKKKV